MARPRNAVPRFSLTDRGGRLYVTWWEDGAKRRISTGTADPAAARQFLADFVAGRNTVAPPATPSIGAILDGYLADRKPQVAAYATIEAACKALRRHIGDLSATALTKERTQFYARQRQAEGYLVGPPSARRRKPVSAGTIARELVTLRAALRWAIGAKWLRAEDEPKVAVPSGGRPRERWLREPEAARLLAGCHAPHIRLFVALALHTAARSGAILDLTWDRVDLEAKRIDMGESEGGKGRAVVPISGALLSALAEAHAARTGGHVIETPGGDPVKSIKTGFRAACRRAGLTGVTPHTLRHTSATWMALAGVRMRDISHYLGHSSVTVTEAVYAKHHPDYLGQAAEALSRAFPVPLAQETARPGKRKA